MDVRYFRTLFFIAVMGFVIRIAYAKDVWIQVKSTNFHLISNAGERETKQTAFKLEQFRYLLSQIFPQAQLNPSVPTTVVVFKNAKSFKPFLPTLKGNAKEVDGYFQRGHDKNFMAINIGAATENPYEVIFHEYVHLILTQNLKSIPLWLQEGLAEFYSNCEIADKNVTLGKYLPQHMMTLRQGKLIPLEHLVQVDRKSPYYNEDEKTGLFYAESWAFTHYLILGTPSEGQKQLAQFIDLLVHDTDRTDAFKKAFGADFRTIQEGLRNYIGSTSLKYYRFKLKSIDADKEFAVTMLQPAQVSYFLGDLLLHSHRFDEAKPYLQQALHADPNFGPAHESLGLGHLYQGNYQEAKRHLKLAVESNSQNYLAHYYYARAMMREMSAQPGMIASIPDEQALKMINSLKKAIELAPHFADAYELMGFIYLVRGDHIDEGIGLVKKAIVLAPNRQEFGLTLAQLYIRKQDFAQAKEILWKILTITQDDALRTQCQERLGVIGKLFSSKE